METEKKLTLEEMDYTIESHVFTCYRHKDIADNGFTNNIYLLLEAVQHSEKVQDETIKLIAKGIYNSVIHHKIVKHDMKETNKKLNEWREKEGLEKL